MKSFVTFCLATFLLVSKSHAIELQPVFDGKSFNGWQKHGDAIWEIENETIVGRTGGGGFGWLCLTNTYGDFQLELDVKITDGNSGIQIRSNFEPKEKMVGYQIEVDNSPRRWSGGLYEQGRRGWLNNLTNNEPARMAFKRSDWNHYRIECVGDSIKSWVNGVPATDYVDSMDIEGLIGLQVHSGKSCKVEFRNIRLANLGKRKWQSLWDGKSFSGWHKTGSGTWKIANELIIGKHEKADKQFGHLVSDRVFTNFTVRVSYKAKEGNSGLYFRSDEGGRTGVRGFQVEIDETKDTGGLYETEGRAWVVKPTEEQTKKWFKPQDWNTMTVSAGDSRIAVDVNGFRTAELRDDPGRKQGHLALQLHADQDVEIYFNNIEILGEPSQSK